MLPHDDVVKQPKGMISNKDLMSSAKKSAMTRLMSAIKSDDAEQALDAFADLKELCED